MMFNKKNLQLLFVLFLIILFLSAKASALFGPPTVTTLPATNITSTSATLRGSVNPNNYSTDTSFVSYVTPSSLLLFPETPKQNIGDGASPVEVSYTQTNLMPGTIYTYAVKAINFRGLQVGSEVTFTTLILPPIEPQAIKATVSGSSITLDWSAPSSDGGSVITSYKIYRGTTSGGETSFSTSNTLTYTDTSVISGQTYYYKISAVNSVGEGTLSKEAPAIVPTPPKPSPTPTPVTLPLNIIITSTKTSVRIGETSTITIIVIGDGKEISGASVMLGSTKEGNLDHAAGTTDIFGNFTSTFTGIAAGKAVVRANVQKANYEKDTEEIQITVNPTPTPSLSPSPTPTPTLRYIKYKILNFKTSDPIQGAAIILDGKSVGLTVPDGSFEFNSYTGNHTISVVKEGFETINQTVNISDEEPVILYIIPSSKEKIWSWIIEILILILIIVAIGSFLWIRGKLQLEPKITSVPGDGKSSIPIKIQFTNIFGKLRKQSKDCKVEMETIAGTIQNVIIPAGKESIEATLTSSKECGSVTITARYGKQKATTHVEFTCNEASLEVEISPGTIKPDGKSTANVNVKIRDADGNYIISLNERTVEFTTTHGTITSSVRFPPKNPAAVGVITSSAKAETATVKASCYTKEGKPIVGEGKVVFGEDKKRYCMHCGNKMSMDRDPCPICGKMPPGGGDDKTKKCINETCPEYLPDTAKWCWTCDTKQPEQSPSIGKAEQTL